MSNITRKSDAIDVLGEEYKSEVETLDKKISLAMLEKSHFDELVARSVALVEKENVLADENKDFNGARQLFKGIFFKLLADRGVEITEDELSNQIDKLLQGITDKSEAVEEITPSENTPKVDKTIPQNTENKSETVEIEKDEDEIWKPYGGATSLADAQKYVQSENLLSKVYYAYGVFGAVASNILNSGLEVDEQITKLAGLLGEFQKSLTPEKLKEFSEVNKMDMGGGVESLKKAIKLHAEHISGKESPSDSSQKKLMDYLEDALKHFEDGEMEMKMDNTGVELETVKAELETLKALVAGLVNKSEPMGRSASVPDEKIEKTDVHPLTQVFDNLLKEVLPQSGETRKAGLQSILNRMGEEFLSLVQSEQPIEQKSEVGNQEVFRAMIQDAVGPLANQMNQLAQLLGNLQKNQPALVQPPVQRAAVNLPSNLTRPVAPPPSNNGYTIRDIVKMTTTGR